MHVVDSNGKSSIGRVTIRHFVTPHLVCSPFLRSTVERGPKVERTWGKGSLGSGANRTRKRIGYVHGARAHGKRMVSPTLLSSSRLASLWPILWCVPNTLYVRRALLVTAPIVRRVSWNVGAWVHWAFVFPSPSLCTAWWPRLEYTGRAFALCSPRHLCHCVIP